jgi:RNA polymerase sigma factor (sigma-70 family)
MEAAMRPPAGPSQAAPGLSIEQRNDLVRRYQRLVYKWANRFYHRFALLFRGCEADDFAQAAFASLIENLDRWHGSGEPSATYIIFSIRHGLRDQFRAEMRRPAVSESVPLELLDDAESRDSAAREIARAVEIWPHHAIDAQIYVAELAAGSGLTALEQEGIRGLLEGETAADIARRRGVTTSQAARRTKNGLQKLWEYGTLGHVRSNGPCGLAPAHLAMRSEFHCPRAL